MYTMTAQVTGGQIEIIQDRDGRYRWCDGDESTEVSGTTLAEACERAQDAWPGIVFDFVTD